jgi:hypothetical protein
MIDTVDDLNPPSHGISGDRKLRIFYFVHGRAELVWFPGFNLRPRVTQLAMSICIGTYPFHSVPSPKRLYFPLVIVRCANPRLRTRTHEPVSLLEVSGGAAAYGPRVSLDVNPGLGENVLDLVNPWLQFSVLEDRRGGHGW